ncbi:bactofilin family protein [Taibaiella soli]|uniref:Polymer-forming cytoskeletal protein n=1 Tax=Taibaiella soli TaxID=1649169 RepID=A0A2W2AKZ3_9BACT|nr:polymer-forming cytoskeletal protein [Taibaiella soli]PZF72960.1 polymer-forming cytoskeletal protein [Taibaiella soli]
MFGGNKSKGDFSYDQLANSTTTISTGTVIKGDITSETNVRIDGKIIGNVQTKAKVVIGPEGEIEGDVTAHEADIVGKVTGNLFIKELLQLKDNCLINGNINSGKLQIEPAAVFNGNCQMTPSLNALSQKEEKTKRSAGVLN